MAAQGGSDEQRSRGTREAEEEETRGRTSLLDRITGWVSALVVLAATAIMVYSAVTPHRPPIFTVQPDSVRVAGQGYYLPVHVQNLGDVSVGQVQVRVELMRGADRVEGATATLNFVPGGSTRSVTLVFRHDPRRYRILAEVESYTHL